MKAQEHQNISVVIPVYNAEKSIVAALDSVLNQTYPVAEIILVNDGSKDNSEQVIFDYKNQHPDLEIHYFKQKNQGPSAARNFGIKKAKYPFITFLDSDDVWLNRKNEVQMFWFEKRPDFYLLGGNNLGKNIVGAEEDELIEIPLSRLVLKNYFLTQGVLLRSEVFQQVGYFNESMRFSEDYNLWLRIAAEYKSGLVNTECFNYNNGEAINVNGLSGQFWEMQKGELSNFKELYQKAYISWFKLQALRVFALMKYVRRRFRN
ncbi:MAG: glycosyltransferase family 2 protein [Flavobacteriales bacterium]